MNFKRLFLRNKNNKFLYYLRAILKSALPHQLWRQNLASKLQMNWGHEEAYVRGRVDYYNKLDQSAILSDTAIFIGAYRMPKKIRVYYFDSIEHLRFFDPALKFELVPGDVTHVPDHPSFVKSRPIDGNNKYAVLLKLDKSRHFNFVKDDVPFAEKKDVLVGRSGFSQINRARFYAQYASHPLCDLAKAVKSKDPNFLSIAQHLRYKFILALEGNDVATNLKWIMSSNSIAVMPKPTYETWFMEGQLKPDYHYICIDDDYGNLEEKLLYYISHPEEAKAIVRHANTYVTQFKNRKREEAISLLVLEKYFRYTQGNQ